MGKTPKGLMKAYVDSQKFSRTTEFMAAMKEMFRDRVRFMGLIAWHDTDIKEKE